MKVEAKRNFERPDNGKIPAPTLVYFLRNSTRIPAWVPSVPVKNGGWEMQLEYPYQFSNRL